VIPRRGRTATDARVVAHRAASRRDGRSVGALLLRNGEDDLTPRPVLTLNSADPSDAAFPSSPHAHDADDLARRYDGRAGIEPIIAELKGGLAIGKVSTEAFDAFRCGASPSPEGRASFGSVRLEVRPFCVFTSKTILLSVAAISSSERRRRRPSSRLSSLATWRGALGWPRPRELRLQGRGSRRVRAPRDVQDRRGACAPARRREPVRRDHAITRSPTLPLRHDGASAR
jgi:hypothetical protein